jgi:hypothetical protein
MTSTTRFIIFVSPACFAVGLTLGPVPAFSLPERTTLESILIASAQPSLIGTWKGQGRIVQGDGQGGMVKLTLSFDGKKVRTTQGPSLNQLTTRLEGTTVKYQGSTWTFRRLGSSLGVFLVSPYRRVHYVLKPGQ